MYIIDYCIMLFWYRYVFWLVYSTYYSSLHFPPSTLSPRLSVNFILRSDVPKTSPRGEIALGATLLVSHELLQIYITYIYNLIIVLFSFYLFLVKEVMSQFFTLCIFFVSWFCREEDWDRLRSILCKACSMRNDGSCAGCRSRSERSA